MYNSSLFVHRRFDLRLLILGLLVLLPLWSGVARAQGPRGKMQEREIEEAVAKEKATLRELSRDGNASKGNAPKGTRERQTLDEQQPTPHREHSWGVAALLYLPNRVLDLFDMFRVRARVGPGVAVGARLTKYVQAYVGTYASVYAGIPGPRLEPAPHSPIGFETYNGIALSVFDATADGGFGPDYSPTEIGAGVQLAILGVDLGFDPVELADFLSGWFGADIREDDF